MNNNELRKLAGLQTLVEKLSDVKTKVEVPEGTFTKKAGSIVKSLMKAHDGDAGKSMKALTFFMNRAGKDMTNKEELEKAKAMIKDHMKMEDINSMRRMAGLPVLAEKKMDMEDMDAEGDADESPKAEKEEEDDMPKIVVALAKKMAKKFGVEKEEDVDGLADMILKVYDAGMKDAEKETVKEDLAAAKAEIHHVMMGDKMVMKGSKQECMDYCAKNKGCMMKKGMPKTMKEDGPVPPAGVPGLERQAAATAMATNKDTGTMHKQDMDFDPAKGATGSPVVHKQDGVDAMTLIKNLHSVHMTEDAAKAMAAKMNGSIGQMHDEDKKYDLAYCVHCMPKM